MARLLVALVLALGLAGCESGEDRQARLVDQAVDNATPSDVPADEVERPEFDNCTSDCSGHEAGFEWAREQDVTDASECSGNSDSFVEGCEAFAQARQQEAEAWAEASAEDGEVEEE